MKACLKHILNNFNPKKYACTMYFEDGQKRRGGGLFLLHFEMITQFENNFKVH